jgi:hypothetical protein
MAERSMINRSSSQPGWRTALGAVLSTGRPQLSDRRELFIATLALRVAGAVLLGVIGYIHWHLWQEGYKHIATNGPLFLADAIVAIVLAVLILVWARPLIGLVAAGFVVATIGALVISLLVGLFGFKESISASFVVESLVLESIAAVLLAAWTVIAAGAVHRKG